MDFEPGKPDPIGNELPLHVLFYCQPKITIIWDQWAKCILSCEHGSWDSVSGGLNLFQAYTNAIEKMMETHPPQCSTTENGVQCEEVEGHSGICYI